MKTLFLLFCFMFVDYFSIFYLNILWTFLWPHLVTSDFVPFWGLPPCPTAGNTLPWSFFSGLLQAWLTQTHLFRVHMCVTCPHLHASALSSHGRCADRPCLLSPNFVLPILFPHRFMSPWRGQAVSFCEEPSTGLMIMNVEWMFKPSLIDSKCLKVWL